MIGPALSTIDRLLARADVHFGGEGPALLTFLFHAILPDREVGPSMDLDDSLVVTSSGFGRYIEYFLSNGYSFVSPDEIAVGLDPDGRYVLSTFDDGYYNNVLALPKLEEYGVPAAFFISTEHIRTGQGYWWDTLYHERMARTSRPPDHAEYLHLKALTHDTITEYLTEHFGHGAVAPRGDHDRPMTPEELRDFADSPWVHLGNHTMHHAILTNYGSEEARAELQGAQDYLAEVLGSPPIAVSYPNGNHSDEVVAIAHDCGLRVGITTIEKPNPTSPSPAEKLRLGRFRFDYRDERPQDLLVYRSRYSLRRSLRRLRAHGTVG